ncbi:hypothetical protein OEZ86_014420 [Tetradesmus obliquus]|nr:hypothetical protein OEZ86_014420 [Tetradesmus obliquus]
MSRCPNPRACLGFPAAACAAAGHPQHALRQCHPSCNTSTPSCVGGGTSCSSNCSTATYLARQCAEGYSGVLCAVCAPGYGPKGLLLRCSRCIGQRAAAAVFAVAVLVLLLGIRFWAYLAESENVELAAAACAVHPAAHQTPPPPHPPGPSQAAAPGEALHAPGRA